MTADMGDAVVAAVDKLGGLPPSEVSAARPEFSSESQQFSFTPAALTLFRPHSHARNSCGRSSSPALAVPSPPEAT